MNGLAGSRRQGPAVVWFTGLSGAGKTTIATLVEQQLLACGRHVCLLDGDRLRLGLNRDLGFTDDDRRENSRRVAEVAALMAETGLIVLVALIAPFRADRHLARQVCAASAFFEVYVDTPLAVAERRDSKGLYRRARSGDLKHFTGLDSPYEVPEHPDLRLNTLTLTAAQAADAVIALLDRGGLFR